MRPARSGERCGLFAPSWLVARTPIGSAVGATVLYRHRAAPTPGGPPQPRRRAGHGLSGATFFLRRASACHTHSVDRSREHFWQGSSAPYGGLHRRNRWEMRSDAEKASRVLPKRVLTHRHESAFRKTVKELGFPLLFTLSPGGHRAGSLSTPPFPAALQGAPGLAAPAPGGSPGKGASPTPTVLSQKLMGPCHLAP